MFRIEWYKEGGQWFSTSYVQGIYGFIGSNIEKITKEIEKGLNWWKSPVTYQLFYGGQNVTEEYTNQKNAVNPHKIDYGML